MEAVGVARCPVTPAGDGGFTMAEDAHGRTHVQALGKDAEHLPDTGWGRLEVGEGGAPARPDRGPTGLAPEVLDPIRASLVPIGDQGVDPGIRDADVGAAGPAAGVAVRRDTAWCPAPAPPLVPGSNRPSCCRLLRRPV